MTYVIGGSSSIELNELIDRLNTEAEVDKLIIKNTEAAIISPIKFILNQLEIFDSHLAIDNVSANIVEITNSKITRAKLLETPSLSARKVRIEDSIINECSLKFESLLVSSSNIIDTNICGNKADILNSKFHNIEQFDKIPIESDDLTIIGTEFRGEFNFSTMRMSSVDVRYS